MFRLFLALMTASCSATVLAEDSERPTSVLDHVERTLAKEPVYKSTPKYSLLVLGPNAKVRVWMVEDDKQLYVDRNANGDLTDDGPPIQPSNVRKLDDDRWDFNYLLDAITPADGARHTDFDLRRWNYGDEKDDSYGLSLSLNGQVPMYAGWFGTFWSLKPETAPMIHFGGSLTPRMLRSKEFTIGSGPRRLSMAFTNPGSGEGAASRLSIDALPPEVVPKLTIEWPTAGGPARRTSHDLTKRCCYWEFYTFAFEVPDDIVVGTAKVSVEFPGLAMPLELTTTEIEVPVVEQSKERKD